MTLSHTAALCCMPCCMYCCAGVCMAWSRSST